MVKRSAIFTAFLVFIVAASLFADDREENIDVFVVLDKSASMVEEIEAVREYVERSIIDNLLITGDQLVLVTFYGEAEASFMGTIDSEKKFVRDVVRQIEADGRFTDIGNALDMLRETIPLAEIKGRRKYVLLITDGQQEAPPESKYFSTDEAFNHEFLQNAKEIRMEGWKIHILGIGSESAAQEVAEELSATYAEVPEEPTVEELEESTSEFLGIVELIGEARVGPIADDGDGSVRITVASKGFTSAQRIIVDALSIEATGAGLQISIDTPFAIEVAPESTTEVRIPILVEPVPAAGTYTGLLTFSFDGSAAFTPATVPVEIRVKSFVGNNVWIIPVGVLILGALAALVVVMAKRSGSISFTCEIDDGSVRKRNYKLKWRDRLYIIDGVMGFNILPNAGQTPAGELQADADGLHLQITDAKQLSVESVPKDLIGQTLEARKQSGKKAKFTFAAT